MTHPNSLPDNKDRYLASLYHQKSLRQGLGPCVFELALLMYHCEVPYTQAVSFMGRLARTQFRTTFLVQQIPDEQLKRIFRDCGAEPNETQQFIATLNTKRAPGP